MPERNAVPLPPLIQGGMGVAVSSWPLARAVSMAGQLGVVSGTALDAVIARRLQDGDPGGHLREALKAFPVPEIAERVLGRYFRADGRSPAEPYTPVPRLGLRQDRHAQELTVVGQLRRGLAGQAGTPGPGGNQLPGQDPDGHARGGLRRDARRGRRRAGGRRNPARAAHAAQHPGPARAGQSPGRGHRRAAGSALRRQPGSGRPVRTGPRRRSSARSSSPSSPRMCWPSTSPATR